MKRKGDDTALQKYYLGAKNHLHFSVLGVAEFWW